MFLKSITDTREINGKILLTAADSYGNGEEFFSLSAGEFSRLPFELRENDEITEEIYDVLHGAAERTGAIEEAARILSLGTKSSREVKFKLKMKNFSPEAIERAVNLLTKKGYLNDEKNCADIAGRLLETKHYGKSRIKSYLISHGYDSKTAQSAADLLDEEELRAALLYNIERKFPDIADFSPSQRQKAISSLMRLGFSAGEIIKEIKNIREK